MFLICIAAFLWGVGTEQDQKEEHLLTRKQAAIPRLIASVILAIGAVYFVCILLKFNSYGIVEEDMKRMAERFKSCHPHDRTHRRLPNAPIPEPYYPATKPSIPVYPQIPENAILVYA
jgi:hypothetical protein